MGKPIMIYDIFCDASVGSDLRGCCSGALIERRQSINSYPDRTFQYTIQPEGTNNSGEVAAVALGLSCAISLHKFMSDFYDPKFNIFSDSLITIRGIKEWLPGWVNNSDSEGNLMNYSRSIVANQQFFKFIYNSILANPNLNVNFFHQDGHVTSNFEKIRENFRKFNGVDPEVIGKTPMSLCMSNDFVDRETRKIITEYLSLSEKDRPEDWKTNQLNFAIEFYKHRAICDPSPQGIEQYRRIVTYH